MGSHVVHVGISNGYPFQIATYFLPILSFHDHQRPVWTFTAESAVTTLHKIAKTICTCLAVACITIPRLPTTNYDDMPHILHRDDDLDSDDDKEPPPPWRSPRSHDFCTSLPTSKSYTTKPTVKRRISKAKSNTRQPYLIPPYISTRPPSKQVIKPPQI